MPKISALPPDTVPTTADFVAQVDAETSQTKRSTWAQIIAMIFGNVDLGSASPVTRDNENLFDYVASGAVWSGDSYAVNRNASMTSGVIYIDGKRLTMAAVSARTFTASKDTYIDASDNGDGTALLTYTEVANNAASPALAASSVRIGIIVTGATTIADAGSVNQGQETKILPIASSIPYQVTDSLGNLICPRDPNRKVLGFRQRLSAFSVTATETTPQQVTGLTCPVIVPTGRKVKVTVYAPSASVSAVSNIRVDIWDGVVNSGTLIERWSNVSSTANYDYGVNPSIVVTPTSASKTYNAGLSASTLNDCTMNAGTTTPMYILVELW